MAPAPGRTVSSYLARVSGGRSAPLRAIAAARGRSMAPRSRAARGWRAGEWRSGARRPVPRPPACGAGRGWGASSWAACREIPSGAPASGPVAGRSTAIRCRPRGCADLGPGLVFADGFEVFEYGPGAVQVSGSVPASSPASSAGSSSRSSLLPQLPPRRHPDRGVIFASRFLSRGPGSSGRCCRSSRCASSGIECGWLVSGASSPEPESGSEGSREDTAAGSGEGIGAASEGVAGSRHEFPGSRARQTVPLPYFNATQRKPRVERVFDVCAQPPADTSLWRASRPSFDVRVVNLMWNVICGRRGTGKAHLRRARRDQRCALPRKWGGRSGPRDPRPS